MLDWERNWRGAGVAFVVLTVVAFFVYDWWAGTGLGGYMHCATAQCCQAVGRHARLGLSHER